MRLRLALVLLTLSCATPRAQAPATPSPLDEPAARRAAQLAPDLYARAERARAAAQSAGAKSRADYEQRAELLLGAAIAEAERITAQIQIETLAAREAAALAKYAAAERERVQLERAIARAQVSEELAIELARAKALAQSRGPARGQGRRAREQAEREATRVLLGHAGLLLAAARALRLAPERIATLEQAKERAAAEKKPGRALASAFSALSELEHALAELSPATSAQTAGQAAPVP